MILSRISFGQLDRYLSSGIPNPVQWLAEDLLIPGNILYCDHFTIKTTDGTQSVLLAGVESTTGYTNGAGETAKFNKIASFVQLNSSHVVIADRRNSCIRLLDRTDNTVSDYAGRCHAYGYLDGKFAEALLNNPRCMVKGEEEFSHLIFATESDGNSIRYLDNRDEVVGTVVNIPWGGQLPTGLTIDTEYSKSLIVAHSSKIIRRVAIKLNRKGNYTDLYRYAVGDTKDGEYSEATLPNTRGIMGIARGVYLIPTNQSRIRVLDTHDEMISSICTGQPEYRSGSISECAIPGSYSISLVGRTLYIGGKTAIYKMLSKFIMETVYSVV